MKEVKLHDNGESVIVYDNVTNEEEFRFTYIFRGEILHSSEYAYRMLRNVFLPENHMEEKKDDN